MGYILVAADIISPQICAFVVIACSACLRSTSILVLQGAINAGCCCVGVWNLRRVVSLFVEIGKLCVC